MARPPISIAQKRANGDTRKLGANKFQESLGGTWEPKRGRPKFPSGLLFRATRPTPGEPESIAAERKVREDTQRKRLALARAHWKYVADHLEAEGKLALLDEGMLTMAALLYAQMIEAGRDGDTKALDVLTQRYGQVADRMGLNESARVKIPGSARSTSDPLQDAIGPRSKTA